MITLETVCTTIDHPLGEGMTECKIIKFHHHESFERFKDLINRALNTYANAHPELKELGDILTSGKVLQDYYSQRTDKPSK